MQNLTSTRKILENILQDTLTPPEFILLGQLKQKQYVFSLIDITGAGLFAKPQLLTAIESNANYHEFFDAITTSYCLTPAVIAKRLIPRGVIIFDNVSDIPKYLHELRDDENPNATLFNLENRPYVVLAHIETPNNKIMPHKNALKSMLNPDVQLY